MKSLMKKFFVKNARLVLNSVLGIEEKRRNELVSEFEEIPIPVSETRENQRPQV
jgi:hypothetical protein